MFIGNCRILIVTYLFISFFSFFSSRNGFLYLIYIHLNRQIGNFILLTKFFFSEGAERYLPINATQNARHSILLLFIQLRSNAHSSKITFNASRFSTGRCLGLILYSIFLNVRLSYLQMGLNERAEPRFVWNGFLLQPFQSQNLKSYCLPLVHGCKFLFVIIESHKLIKLILYSRVN